jgi:hypothetical protein
VGTGIKGTDALLWRGEISSLEVVLREVEQCHSQEGENWRIRLDTPEDHKWNFCSRELLRTCIV